MLIWNEESQRVRKRTPKKNTVNRYEQEEGERERPAIALYRPIGKAEAADCISQVEKREPAR